VKVAGPDGVVAESLAEFLGAILRDDTTIYSEKNAG
jgi:hypothetical protein